MFVSNRLCPRLCQLAPQLFHRTVRIFGNDLAVSCSLSLLCEAVEEVTVSTQERFAGGEVATAWKETTVGNGHRVILSIADSFPGNTAGAEALATVFESQARVHEGAERPLRFERVVAWQEKIFSAAEVDDLKRRR